MRALVLVLALVLLEGRHGSVLGRVIPRGRWAVERVLMVSGEAGLRSTYSWEVLGRTLVAGRGSSLRTWCISG